MRSNGEVECEETWIPLVGDEETRHPALLFRTEGVGNNLKGKEGRCLGVLIVSVAKDKLYALRMFAWPATEYDEEGIGQELDWLEGGGSPMSFLDLKAAAPEKPPANGGGDAPPAEEPDEGEERKEEVIDDIAQGWRIVKDAKLTRVLPFEDEDGVFHFADQDQHGGYQILFYAISHSKIVDGQQTRPPDLRAWITTDWWKFFNPQHPQGEVATWKWPKRTERRTFVTLPDLGDEELKIVVFKADEKRPPDPSAGDMEKWKAVEKPKQDTIGPRGKVSEAMRGLLIGNRPGFGVETIMRFGWRNRMHSYRLFVTVWGQGHVKYGDAIRNTLESLEFGLKD
jgi:hypothetical protein